MEDVHAEARTLMDRIQTTTDSAHSLPNYMSYNDLVDRAEELTRGNDRFAALPAELLHQIFHDYCYDKDVNTNAPFVLSLVCTRWASIMATIAADLWTRVEVASSNVNWLECLEVQCEKSRDKPLDVTLQFPFSLDELDQIAAKGHLERWKTLVIVSSRNELDQDIFRFPLRMREAPVVLHFLQNREFPLLESIDVRIKTAAAGSSVLWSNLFSDSRTLDNVSVKPLIMSHLTVNLFFIDFSLFMALLGELRALVYLRFLAQRRPTIGTVTGQSSTSQPIPLDRLREMYIEQSHLCMPLLDRIQCQNLEKLSALLLAEEIPTFYQRIAGANKLKEFALTLYGVPSPSRLDVAKPLDIDAFHLTHSAEAIEHGDSSSQQTFDMLLQLFSRANHVTVRSDQASFDWYRTLCHFESVEDLLVERTKGLIKAKDVELALSSDSLTLGRLRSLRANGGACNVALGTMTCPKLQTLKLSDTSALSLPVFYSFLQRTPDLRALELEAVQISKLSAAYITGEVIALTNLRDLAIMHDALGVLDHLVLPNLRELRPMGVLQEKSTQRGMLHFTQRRIHLDKFLLHRGARAYPTSLLTNITHLDLCISKVLFPSVAGFKEILPALSKVEKFSLPRTFQNDLILVDILVKDMLHYGTAERGLDGGLCPHLVEIMTDDYPSWPPLMELLARRNMTLHLSQEERSKRPRPLACLSLPALPHPSILRPMQEALAGKYPIPSERARRSPSLRGCDDCALSGWYCLELIEERTNYRSQCSRHKQGTARVTAYS
ncbi:hypothetical protein PIIN_00298 [Serendipita indica DSM 11827]|uniref:Uncharacterized protein n=1 Tax=Serendipita indica (strain DSM 11827) TaxID=1109443 RepID=G4T5I8_SERID|nr:hypothetical protein PIIN_00298 [Serendipita indica DSM 11827]